ncbi:hypothetical protein [Streptococcus mutans]|uniref:hypothetical protein n=1 Tax=Streptococcus mutans TaxID=1309 RepID=UPI0002B5A076|nr:hypothetical protein [Streptococcus mutans]EMC49358.1 hypothetical protein SMU104_07970 [Streptococcus mutans SA41]MDP5872916.1 hypothetical protein [Streptococcus mutans]
MFEGTSFIFKILYFLTAMMPAYMLFCAQSNLYLWILPTVILFMSIGIGLLLKFSLQNRAQKNLGVGISNYTVGVVNSKNGDITAFLLGVIIPSVISLSDDLTIKVIGFLILQILLFILMIKSSSIFPNILMLLLGMNIFELDDGKYIIAFTSQLASKQDNKINIRRMGDSEFCSTYIRE